MSLQMVSLHLLKSNQNETTRISGYVLPLHHLSGGDIVCNSVEPLNRKQMRNLLTGYECLALFTDEVQEKIKANVDNLYDKELADELMVETYVDKGDFLLGVFVWGVTYEGHDYWADICDKCY